MPKAKPLHSSGSMPTLRKTWGCTMPHPRISIQPVWEQVPQPLPPQKTHEISISADGSVKGKKLGRIRIFVWGVNNRCRKCSRVPRRCPMLIPRSTSSPSAWWNIGERRMVISSRRNTLPHDITLIGGLERSIVRICTLLVWVRRRSFSERKNVSCVSRAGWSGVKLSASKLYQSVSTSGPGSIE